MFNKGIEDGRKGEIYGGASQDCISNQSENGIPVDQN
jgi:hypothetical protein